MLGFKRLAMVVSAAMLATSSVCAAAPYDRLYVFGDSLVDSGNAATQVPGSAPASGRFTNGLNFADDVSLALGFGPATAYLQGGTNYAVGGSTVATFFANQIPPDLGFQITGYYEPSTLTTSPLARRAAIDANSLVLITSGGNDVRDYGFPGAPSPLDTVTALRTDLTRLIMTDGARNIIVVGLPDVGQIPSIYGTAAQANATLASTGLNTQYSSIVDSFQQQLGTSGSIRLFDLATLQTSIQDHPADYGLDPALVHSSCVATGGLASDCAGYLYYDGIHPTAYVHGLIAQAIVASIPDPTTWAMMIVGFGLTGATLRRRGPAAAMA